MGNGSIMADHGVDHGIIDGRHRGHGESFAEAGIGGADRIIDERSHGDGMRIGESIGDAAHGANDVIDAAHGAADAIDDDDAGAGIAERGSAHAAHSKPRFADVIFDYCDVLLDWRPRLVLEGAYPAATLDWFFDARTSYGFWHYDALSDSGWSEDAIVADFAAHHSEGLPGVDGAAGAAGMSGAAGAAGHIAAAGGPASLRGDGKAAAALFRTYFARQNLALRGMIPGMAGLLSDLDAAGVRLWGLTNFTAKFVHAAWDRYPAFGLLRGTVVSSEERIRKPDAEIYRRTVERFGINPATAAFVDDKERNARASEAVGLTGVRFLDAAQARAALLGGQCV